MLWKISWSSVIFYWFSAKFQLIFCQVSTDLMWGLADLSWVSVYFWVNSLNFLKISWSSAISEQVFIHFLCKIIDLVPISVDLLRVVANSLWISTEFLQFIWFYLIFCKNQLIFCQFQLTLRKLQLIFWKFSRLSFNNRRFFLGIYR